FDHYFLANALKVAIPPCFKWEGRRLAATFFHRSLVAAARGMRVNLIRRPKHDISTSAVGLPTWDTSCVVLVGIRDTPVVLFLILILFRVGRRIATLPES